MRSRGRSWQRAVARLAIGGLAGALLTVLGFAPSAMAAPVSHFRVNANVSLTEGDAGVTNMTFTISYTGTKNNISVDWTTADGTATAGADYVASSGTVTFTATGATSQTITIPVIGDLLDEANETFTVNLSNPQPPAVADITTATRTGTIRDDDPTPSLAIDDLSLPEGNTGTTNAVLTVTLSAPSGRNVTVHYATANSTAVQPSDYAATSGNLTFLPGQLALPVSVTIMGDTTSESDEAFFVNLSSGGNASIADNRGVVTIVNDDALPSLTIDDVSRTEGNSGSANLKFTVSLAPASGSTVTVSYATADVTATAPADYTSRTGTLTFNAGQTSKTISVPVVGDTLDEDDETFVVNLSAPTNATVADAQGIGTIVDNDATPSVGINNATVTEGDVGTVTATFTATLSAVSGRTVTVDYATADITATAPTDYAAASGTLTFPAGTTTRTIPIAVQGDLSDEADETYQVALSNPVNVTISTAIGTGTITDNDAPPSIAINDVSQTEGNAGTTNMNFDVSLSVPSGLTVTVNYATADSTAIQPGDYTTTSGTLTFTPGQGTKTISVPIVGDTTDEVDETFFVNLSGATNASIADAQGVGTIVDDDPLPSLTINDVSLTEGDAGTTVATFTISLTNPSAFPISVDVSTADQTATTPGDYGAVSTTVWFAPGQVSTTVDVPVQGDTAHELDETFAVDLSNPTGAALADADGVGTIVDDDAAPVLDVGDVTVTEGDVGDVTASFPVILTGATQVPATVDVATADGTATQPADYDPAVTTLTFAPGETTKTVDVTIHGDTLFELDETFTLHLSNPAGATIGIDPGFGTIVNDDSAPDLAITDVSLPEGDTGDSVASFTVVLGAPSASPISVDVATVEGTATQPTDYDPVATTLTFAPGETTKTVDVTIHGDTTVEPDETFTVQLSNPVGAGIADGIGSGTIVNDDAVPAPLSNKPTASIGDTSVVEGGLGTTTTLSFPVSLSKASSDAVTVVYGTSDRSATAGSDYVGAAGSVRIPAGETTASVPVTVTGDDVIEPDETLALEITNVFGATMGSAGTGTIVNDDREITHLILRAKGRHHHVVSRGRMLHAEPGMRVRVVLLRRMDSGFVPIARATVRVHVRGRGSVRTGIFKTRFSHQRFGRYVVRATFAGDVSHMPSRARARVRL
jgi:Calx-beta domain